MEVALGILVPIAYTSFELYSAVCGVYNSFSELIRLGFPKWILAAVPVAISIAAIAVIVIRRMMKQRRFHKKRVCRSQHHVHSWAKTLTR